MGPMVAQRLTAEVSSLADLADVVVLPAPCPIDIHPMDFRHARVLMTRAAAESRAFLQDRCDPALPIGAGRTGTCA